MATIASLFPSTAQAKRALDALSNAGFADVRIEVLEPEGEGATIDPDDMSAVDAGGTTRIAGAPYNVDLFMGLNDQERHYVTTRINFGDTAIVALVDDDRVEPLKAFFREHGGNTEMR